MSQIKLRLFSPKKKKTSIIIFRITLEIRECNFKSRQKKENAISMSYNILLLLECVLLQQSRLPTRKKIMIVKKMIFLRKQKNDNEYTISSVFHIILIIDIFKVK